MARVGIQPIVATPALLVGGRGLTLVIAGGQLKNVRDPAFLALGTGALLGIPVSVLVAAVLAMVVELLVSRTTFGRRLVAIGGKRAVSGRRRTGPTRVDQGVDAVRGTRRATFTP